MISKTHLAAAALAALLAGCGSITSTPATTLQAATAVPVPVGPGEYLMTAGSAGARAYLYGGVTVIEWETEAPAMVHLRDGRGFAVPTESFGRYMRADRRLESFSITRFGAVVAAGLMPVNAPAPASAPSAMPKAPPAPPAAINAPGSDGSAARAEALASTIRDVEVELASIRRILASRQARNPRVIADVNRRIDALERRVAAAQKPAVTAVAQR
jgi:hypothetical protein